MLYFFEMSHFLIHTLFDLLALLASVGAGWLVIKTYLYDDLEQTAGKLGYGYFIFLFLGSIGGAYFFGTLNLWFSGHDGFGRSILGSLFGATMSVELYKLLFKRHQKKSTGYIYVVPFCVLVIVGRIGCLLSGIDDYTYGVPSTLPWAMDFGDGVLRHPVAAYESLSMLGFLISVIVLLRRNRPQFIAASYYLCVGFYGAQRYVWEFLKPYEPLIAGQNIFHFLCLALVVYSFIMLKGIHRDRVAA